LRLSREFFYGMSREAIVSIYRNQMCIYRNDYADDVIADGSNIRRERRSGARVAAARHDDREG